MRSLVDVGLWGKSAVTANGLAVTQSRCWTTAGKVEKLKGFCGLLAIQVGSGGGDQGVKHHR